MDWLKDLREQVKDGFTEFTESALTESASIVVDGAKSAATVALTTAESAAAGSDTTQVGHEAYSSGSPEVSPDRFTDGRTISPTRLSRRRQRGDDDDDDELDEVDDEIIDRGVEAVGLPSAAALAALRPDDDAADSAGAVDYWTATGGPAAAGSGSASAGGEGAVSDDGAASNAATTTPGIDVYATDQNVAELAQARAVAAAAAKREGNLKTKLAAERKRANQLMVERSQLEDAVAQANALSERLRAQLGAAQESSAGYQATVQNLEDSLKAEKSAVEEEKRLRGETESRVSELAAALETKMGSLADELHSKDETEAKLSAEAASTRKEVNELKALLAAASSDAKRVAKDAETSKASLVSTQAELAETREMLKMSRIAQAAAEARASANDETLASMTLSGMDASTKAKLESEKRDLARRIETLEAEMNDMRDGESSSAAERERAVQEKEELRHVVAKYEFRQQQDAQRVAAAEASRDEALAETAALRADGERRSAMFQSAVTAAASRATAGLEKEREALAMQVSSLESELTASRERASEMSDQLESLLREAAELKDSADTAKSHAREADDARRRAVDAAEASARRFQENETAKAAALAELEALKSESDGVQRELSDAKRNAASLHEELTATRGMLKRGEGAAKRAERELRDRLEELEGIAAAATAAAASSKSAVSSDGADLAGSEGFQILTPEPSNPAQMRRYDTLRDELAAARSELSSLKIRHGMLEKDFESVSQKWARAQQAQRGAAGESLLGSLGISASAAIAAAPAPSPTMLGRSSSSKPGSGTSYPFGRIFGSRGALLMVYIFLIHVMFMASLARKPKVCLPGDEIGSRLP